MEVLLEMFGVPEAWGIKENRERERQTEWNKYVCQDTETIRLDSKKVTCFQLIVTIKIRYSVQLWTNFHAFK